MVGRRSDPPPSRDGETDHVGQYLRPTVTLYRFFGPTVRNDAEIYRGTLVDELADATNNGWTPTFTRCDPRGVTVDVAKEVDGRTATGRTEIILSARPEIYRTAILSDHRDGDSLPVPDLSGSSDLDLSVCAEIVDAPTWSGLPTQYDRVGGPAVVD